MTAMAVVVAHMVEVLAHLPIELPHAQAHGPVVIRRRQLGHNVVLVDDPVLAPHRRPEQVHPGLIARERLQSQAGTQSAATEVQDTRPIHQNLDVCCQKHTPFCSCSGPTKESNHCCWHLLALVWSGIEALRVF